ncbi:hypothetical protein J6590_094491 [Homalodisca vitripennis]|nr:hypothetical protein J6590_094491 [Homalodisca vitripennis]
MELTNAALNSEHSGELVQLWLPLQEGVSWRVWIYSYRLLSNGYTKENFIETLSVVYERLPSQAGVQFLNRLPNSIKHAPTPKALKTRLKRFLVSQAFYNAGEFLAFDWETAQLED